MDLTEFLRHVDAGLPVRGGTPAAAFQRQRAVEVQRLTAELNTGYRTPEEIRALMERITGRAVPESFGLFPPFTTDFGANIHLGEQIFINSGCRFQDQDGIWIGDRCFIGHDVVMATLDHSLAVADRATTHPAPIRLGNDVWVGAKAVITSGVSIGDGAVIAGGRRHPGRAALHDRRRRARQGHPPPHRRRGGRRRREVRRPGRRGWPKGPEGRGRHGGEKGEGAASRP